MMSPSAFATDSLHTIPAGYARVKLKIPKFGLYAFDFRFSARLLRLLRVLLPSSYNRTQHSGLLNLLPNSYCNALLQVGARRAPSPNCSVSQVLYYTPTLRTAMLNHLCGKESCLTCELGFLFRASKTACQTSLALQT